MSKRAYEAKHVRGTILVTLGDYFPNGLSAKTVHEHIVLPVFPNMDRDETLQHLSYLEKRAYIERVATAGPGRTDSARARIYRLTAVGLDVAQGVIEDPTILVEG